MAASIKTMTLPELEEVVAAMDLPRFRAKQLHHWLHAQHASSYDQMTNLPKAMRERLAKDYPIEAAHVVEKQVSADGTRKYVVRLVDGALVEMVGIPSIGANDQVEKLTVCFSTQVGCAMTCAFCATGQNGFTRNLTADEMVDQVVLVGQDFDARVSNVVAMGQGEPFLNIDELMRALRIMNSPDDLNIGARHITVSTCGIIPGIEQMSQIPEQFTLAVSLHASRQPIRNLLMPHLENQQLGSLKKALLDYVDATNRRVTLEYILLDGINDSEKDLDALIAFCRGLHCHVNLIPFNAVPGSSFSPSNRNVQREWQEELARAGVETTVRRSRGNDIDSACGQLRNAFV